MGTNAYTSSPPPPAASGPEEPMAYQQPSPDGMQYQQQPQSPIPMNAGPRDQPSYEMSQLMYGQPPPQPDQGGPISSEAYTSKSSQQATQYQTATPIPNLGMSPAPVDCPACGKRGMTKISHHAGNTTHVWAIVAYCFTICLFFIPYLMTSLKDVDHNCSNCGTMLATWHKSGVTEPHAHV